MSETQTNETEQEIVTPKKKTWSEFVYKDVTDFFQANHLKSLSIEDDEGNKAKLGVKMLEGEEVLRVEISSTQYI